MKNLKWHALMNPVCGSKRHLKRAIYGFSIRSSMQYFFAT